MKQFHGQAWPAPSIKALNTDLVANSLGFFFFVIR